MTQGTAVAKRGTGGAAKPPAVVAAIPKAGLKVFKAHRADLDLGWEYDEDDGSGKLVTRVWPVGRVDEYTKLVPEETCRAIIAELDAALVPALYGQAKALAMTVMGRYTKRDLYDIETFLFELTRVFGEAPADLGREACDRLRTNVYLPNTADAKIVLDALVRERRNARSQVERHLAERERRRAAAAEPKPDVVTPEEAAAILEESGLRQDLDDAAAARQKPKRRLPIHQRAHDLAMEEIREKIEAAAAPQVDQGAEAGGG